MMMAKKTTKAAPVAPKFDDCKTLADALKFMGGDGPRPRGIKFFAGNNFVRCTRAAGPAGQKVVFKQQVSSWPEAMTAALNAAGFKASLA